jgi:hypothetical protein
LLVPEGRRCGWDVLVPFTVAVPEARTPQAVIALGVFVVIVIPDTDDLIMLRKATVLRDRPGSTEKRRKAHPR